ncbi:hypothetical protein DD238_005861 [Peronospora effusa]|uniref:Arf-GAP domain-containing protein n=1 Tax=Peronospora effusa TaxID=542832 RepID=A0A3M6VCW8_9STRA|nr:hypothetical protein DD238_005861 [Peronospora effusa]RQM13386.1 hypothetical protein DD237_006039 [Peronospora effusa]
MTHQMPMETQQELRQLPGNNRCVDCDAPYPQWATVSYGTFMCLECSGRHRGLGVHISFVRSVTMDSWTDKQVMQMQNGGNDSFRAAFSAAGVPKDLSIGEKYNTPQAEAYRQRLTAIVEGRAPQSLPPWDSSMNKPSSSSFSSASYSGGGSAGGDTRGVEALKGESEQDYVARQMKLREEARARMAAKFGSNGMQGIGSGGETRARQASSGGLGDLSGAFSFITSTVTTAASSAASLVKDQDLGSKVSSGWSYVQNAMQDPALSNNVKSSATSGWSVLSSGASALLQTAQTAVNGNGSANDNLAGMSSAFPRTNEELPTSSKYAGIGSGNSSTSRDHNNDSWLDSQLSNSGSSNSNPNSGSFYTPPQQPKPAPTSDLFGSSSSSTNGSNYDLLGLSSSSVASATSSNGSAAAPSPAPVVKETKPAKDVDFFGEFGF